jgi:hypothetical protein
VPNQNTQIKFLIREGLTAKFPKRHLESSREGISHNGTGGWGVIEVKIVISMGYGEIPVTGREVGDFPSWD